MVTGRGIWARLEALYRRRALERGLDEEMRFHVDQQTQKNIRAGMSPRAARRAAVLSFGGVDGFKEEVRDELRAAWLEDLWRDLHHGIRTLARSPGFTVVAVLTLALGIGANTAIFSVVNGILLTPLRLHEPDRLVAIGESTVGGSPTAMSSTSPGSFFDWQRQTGSVQLAGFSGTEGVLTDQGEPERLVGTNTIGGLFGVLGVRPLLGRPLLAADEDAEAVPVIVLGHALWRRLFGEDPGAIGRALTINGVPRTIVGVMPAHFRFPDGGTQFWVPLQFEPDFRANRDQYFIQVVGRLGSGVTLEQARTEFDAVAARLRQDWPTYNSDLGIRARPLQETVVGGVRTRLLVLMGAVGFVLLITCVNLGNLLLARTASRRREIAVRQALGAKRSRVIQQILVESMILALAGGVLALLVGKGFLELLLSARGVVDLPRVDEIGLDLRVFLVTLGVALFAGLFFGSFPTWDLARRRSSDALRDGSRGSAAGSGVRNALVVCEIALAMILLIGAGLLLRSFTLLQRVDPGFAVERLLTFDIVVRPEQAVLLPASLEQIRAVPGVRSAALVSQLPLTGRGVGAWFNRIDRPLPADVTPPAEAYRVVSPEFFTTIGLPLKQGRLLTGEDRRERPAVVINEALAKKHYAGEDAVGKEIYLGAPDNRLFDQAMIVGVVGDTRDAGLGSDPLPTVYIPHAVMPQWRWFSYVIRTTGARAPVAGEARDVFRRLDPNLPVGSVRTMDRVLGDSVALARWSTMLLAIFATVALVTAALGVFGVLSFLVAQRTREFGIRMALGAAPSSVRRLVVAQGLRLIGVGVIFGLAGAFALSRLTASLLYTVTPTDPITYAGVAVVLVGIAGLASYLPARLATRVDPIVTLRSD